MKINSTVFYTVIIASCTWLALSGTQRRQVVTSGGGSLLAKEIAKRIRDGERSDLNTEEADTVLTGLLDSGLSPLDLPSDVVRRKLLTDYLAASQGLSDEESLELGDGLSNDDNLLLGYERIQTLLRLRERARLESLLRSRTSLSRNPYIIKEMLG